MLNIYDDQLREERVINLISSRNEVTGTVFRTFLVRFPKSLLAELNTHRMLVRNCGSSRAIPTKTFIKNLKSDPYVPIFTGLKAGMVGTSLEQSDWRYRLAKALWGLNKSIAIIGSQLFNKLGIHKQDGNRLTEPYAHVDLVLSGTEWDNLLRLRCAPDAQPAFKVVADKIASIIASDKPNTLQQGQWHVPFVDVYHQQLTLEQNMRVAIARIARVSYMRHGNNEIDLESDIKLATNLLKSGHLSPLEHVAKCVPCGPNEGLKSMIQPALHDYLFYDKESNYYRWTRNYKGFYTYRHHIEDNQQIT